jgi:hypothetical protein
MAPFPIVVLLATAVAAIGIAVLLLEDVFASNDRQRLEEEIRAAALRRGRQPGRWIGHIGGVESMCGSGRRVEAAAAVTKARRGGMRAQRRLP